MNKEYVIQFLFAALLVIVLWQIIETKNQITSLNDYIQQFHFDACPTPLQ